MIPQIAMLAVALIAAHPAAPDPPSPAGGHAEVVAQALVSFSSGEHHWEVAPTTVAATASTIDVTGPTFLVSTGPGGVLAGPSGESPAWRPAVGEAIFDHGDESLDVQAVARVGGAVTLIAPASGAGTNPFTPGEGVRDVDLVRDVLTTNEALLLETDVSALVLVTAGSVNAGGTTIAAGTPVAQWRDHPDQHRTDDGPRRRRSDRAVAGRWAGVQHHHRIIGAIGFGPSRSFCDDSVAADDRSGANPHDVDI